MINKAILLGRIVKIENNVTKDGVDIFTITLETTRNHVTQDGKDRQETIWHIVNFFDQMARMAKFLSSVEDIAFIEGEILNRKVNGKMVNSIKGNVIHVVKKDK